MNPFLTDLPQENRLKVLPPEIAFPNMDFPLTVREVHQYFVYGSHSHSGFLELVLVTGGMATHYFGKTRHPISVGDLLVIPEGVKHGYDTIADLRYYNILFNPQKLGLPINELALVPGAEELLNLKNVPNPGGYCHLSTENFEKARLMALELHNIQARQIHGMRFAAIGQLMVLLDFLCRCFAESIQYEPPEKVHRLSQLVDEMESKYTANWDIGDMCRITHLSRPILFREFQKIYNTSPMDYLLNIRMRHACLLLTGSAFSVGEIAAACGFTDSSYFILRFRKRTGMTPRQFRLLSAGGHEL